MARRSVLFPHPEVLGEVTLTSMATLASAYKLEVQVMQGCKTKLGADHPNTLTSMANLASTFWNQGRWEEAERLDVQVLETRKTKFGINHPDTLTSMHNLACGFAWNLCLCWSQKTRDLFPSWQR